MGRFLNKPHAGPSVERIARELPERIAAAAPLRLTLAEPSARTGADLEFRLEGAGIDRRVVVYVIQAKASPDVVRALAEKSGALRREFPDAVPLLASASLSEPLRQQLRSLGLSHADLSGTLYLQEPGLMVRVDGPAKGVRSGAIAPSAAANPFADRASLVLRTLLRDPTRAWGVREIAEARGISPGLASMTAAELARRGYAEHEARGLRLRDAAAALADWIAAVDWSRTRILSFEAPYSPAELTSDVIPELAASAGGQIAVTQLSALDRYAPHVQHSGSVHLYVEHTAWERTVDHVRHAFYAEPAAGGGNLHLALPRAKRSTFFDIRIVQGVPVVSPVQLLLDLAGFSLRGTEAAHMLLRTVLAREVGLTSEQVDRVARALA